MKKVLIIVIGLWCLASCTQEENDAPRTLEVLAEIASQTGTRTTESTVGQSDYDKLTFDSSDEILIQKNSETAVTYKKGTNTWSPKDAANPLTLTINGSNAFNAFYPTASMDIQADQTAYKGFWKSKWLTSTGTLDGNKVTFSFKPAVAKISVVVLYQAAHTTVIASVAGTAIQGGSGSQTINLLKTNTSTDNKRHSFAGIIAPGSYLASAYKITVTADNVAQTYTQPAAKELKAGYNYQYTFTSSDELILTGVTVKPFNDMTEEDSGNAT